MRRSLGGLYCRRNLRIRGREEAGDLFGERLIGRQSRELVLPKIEVAPRQTVEFGGGVVVLGRHLPTITDHRASAASQAQSLPCRTAASALRLRILCKRAFSVAISVSGGKRSAA